MKLPTLRFALILAVAFGTAVRTVAQGRVLTTALEVRSLSVAEAEQGLPVRLRGVVVFVEGPSAIFLQDGTSTAFFRIRPRSTPPRAGEDKETPNIGDEIELTGPTRMGLYLPGLDYSTFRVIGRRPLPPGIPVRYDDLYFGRYHYQRVTVEGIVRSVQPIETGKSLIRLAMGSRVIEARVETPPESGRSLVDHRVRITGLAAGLINIPRRQLVQPYVRALNWNEVEVIAPAPRPSDVPQVSAEELLAFRVSGLGEQRVRIDGVVLATFGSEQTSLRQGAMAFAVRFGTPTELVPGDRVTIVGFPSMERFSASIVDAELIAREPGPALSPLDIDSIDELYGKPGDQQPGKHDGHLVRITATVRDVFKNEEGTTLFVQGGQRTLQARVPDGTLVPPAGARVRLTGICQVESGVTGAGFASRPGLVSLRTASPADLEVLQRPSWWTARRLSAVLAALAGVTLLAGLWIAVLRRQVNRQTMALRHRIESEAALEERQRIAREFHDTLEQELAGVSLRLDALATRELDHKGRDLIIGSRNLVSRIQTETRDLISDLRDPSEIAGDLVAALSAVAARQSTDRSVAVRVETTAPVPALPAGTVHDLRMIARESATNAVKHGGASSITVRIEPGEARLVMRIIDNGRGFDVAGAVNERRGHFGCAGIRERARKLGAAVAWHSTAGAGTRVEVTLPLGSAAATGQPPVPDTVTGPPKTSLGQPHAENAS